MAEIQPQETQQELFDFSGASARAERLPSIQKTHKPILISTSLEQILFAAILGILASCLVFFLGVLRGKAISGPAAPTAVEAVQAPARVAAPAAPPMTARAETAAAVPASAQVMSSAARDASKPYTIQLVTYKKSDLAEREAAALRRNGYYAVVARKGEYYLVWVGQYSGMDEAKKDLKFFGTKYKDRFLRRR